MSNSLLRQTSRRAYAAGLPIEKKTQYCHCLSKKRARRSFGPPAHIFPPLSP